MGEGYTGPVTVSADDGTERVLAENVWEQSGTIMGMVEDTEPGATIPLPGVGIDALDKVVEYMKQMAAFKADGTSDDDKRAWIDGYKKSMEAQEQLPLLFQTLTAANFMNVKTLLDELCKFVAEMIAQRTPDEILDYFNIRKDATWEEEQELIATHKWIDPEGLIWKERWRNDPENKGKSEEELEAAYKESQPPVLTEEDKMNRRKVAEGEAQSAIEMTRIRRKIEELGLPEGATAEDIQRAERLHAAESRRGDVSGK